MANSVQVAVQFHVQVRALPVSTNCRKHFTHLVASKSHIFPVLLTLQFRANSATATAVVTLTFVSDFRQQYLEPQATVRVPHLKRHYVAEV
jgi:hypothetical protein